MARSVLFAPDVIQSMFQMLLQLFMCSLIIGTITQQYLSVAVQRDTIVRIGKIFRSKPEVERVLRHRVERPPRRDRGRSCAQGFRVKLANEGDVTHRERPILRAEIEIVDGKSLLKDRWIRAP